MRRAAVTFAFAVAVLCAAAPASARVPANVNVSQRPGNQQEATIAVDPTNASRVFITSNDESQPAGLFAAHSTDGGRTWSRQSLATGDDGLPAACCDPSASWDSFGNLFLTYLTFIPDGSGGFQFDDIVLLSTNGGASFTELAQLSTSHDTDQPTITTGAGEVWVSYRDFGPEFGENGTLVARGARVFGRGRIGSFNPVQTVPGTEVDGSFGDIVIGPSGQVVVTYQNPSGGEGPAAISTNVDPDGLGRRGFGPSRLATMTNVGGFDFIAPQPFRSVDAEAGLAYDRSGRDHRSTLYLMYTDEFPDESDNTDLFLRRSSDDGATWSAPVRINDDHGTTAQFLPRLSIDDATGVLAVTWHDARNDPVNNRSTQFWGAFSVDGGRSFLPNFQISEGTSNIAPMAKNHHLVQISGIDYGDYTGNDFAQGVLHPAWADNSNSTGDNPPVDAPGTDSVTGKPVTVHTSLLDVYTASIRAPNPDEHR